MENHIDYSGFIERYLNKTLDQDELKWFKDEMEANQQLGEEVKLQQEIGAAILNDETLEFRAQISNLFEQEEKVETRTKGRSLKIPHSVRVAVASIAVLVMSGLGLYMYTHRTIPADILFDKYYAPYEGLMNVRSSNSEVAGILINAMQKYESQQFESALLLFETVLATDKNNITSRFYSGISYMETDRFSNAGDTFSKVINHDDNLFIEHAEWYLGLCYLKTGETEKAKNLFDDIAESKGYYSQQAKRLSRNL